MLHGPSDRTPEKGNATSNRHRTVVPTSVERKVLLVSSSTLALTEIDINDDRPPSQLRPLACSRSILHRAHGPASWSQGETKVLGAVYGSKAVTKKNENPEKAFIELTWTKEKLAKTGKGE
ncbi:hypothetical protein L6164_003860 [Bauhinia variegata]|uniref:Uncharacterized protein n=1 Tax=Bauhinia variegata TaxID=167791 RepID=A0ACB9Q444_BAUVA|nr:hypothetical protein L6164_003860 [Bauhinia variegata]